MRLFLLKFKDEPFVAEGVQFTNGRCVVLFFSTPGSVTTYNSLEELKSYWGGAIEFTTDDQKKELEEHFKVGWIYKNKKGQDVLILHIRDSKIYKGRQPLLGVNLCTQDARYCSAWGEADPIHNNDANLNLIHSTGRPKND